MLYLHKWAYESGVYRGWVAFIACNIWADWIFPDHPHLHIAYAYEQVPPIFWPYNPIKPGSLFTDIIHNLQCTDYQVGALVAKLNSLKGITVQSFLELVSGARKCTGCCCVFSPEGYQAHLGYNEGAVHIPQCLNTPSLPVGECFFHLFWNFCLKHDFTTML